MKAVISVVGHDRPGILASVAGNCAKQSINIVDVTQKVLQDLFTMIMIVEIPDDKADVKKIQEEFAASGEKEGLQIHVMAENIYTAMHTI